MKRKNKNSELLISGNFTEDELKELEQSLVGKNVEVAKYFVKTIDTQEIVRVIFRNFDAYQFLRDGILFELLMLTFNKTVAWIKKKKPKAKISSGVDLRFKTSKKEVPVNIGVPTDNQKFWPEVEKTLTVDFIGSIKEGEIVNIYWDAKDDKMKVSRM